MKRTAELLDQYIPENLVPEELQLKLPTLKKIQPKKKLEETVDA